MNNKKKWISLAVASILITNTITLFGTKSYIENRSSVGKFYKLFEIRSQLYKYYDGNINDSDLVEGAIKGMTGALK